MYVLVALAVTVLVVAMAWRGFGAEALRNREQQDRPDATPPRLHRPSKATRTVAPDDDPEFLREIDRKLRGEDKSG